MISDDDDDDNNNNNNNNNNDAYRIRHLEDRVAELEKQMQAIMDERIQSKAAYASARPMLEGIRKDMEEINRKYGERLRRRLEDDKE